MQNPLIKEFESFEGLGAEVVDPAVLENILDDDDSAFQPAQASSLSNGDMYYELEKRNLKSTGFPDTDREMLQRAFDTEFKADLEDMRAKRRERQKKAAQQAGLQKRRLLMEKSLEEEQVELAKDHQVSIMIEHVKKNSTSKIMRMDCNSISARILAKAMWLNNTIICLDLSFNQLNDHSGTYLARILKKNSTLKKMELDNNHLGPKTCMAFGESLETNTSLEYLSLDSNPLCPDGQSNGIEALAESLTKNKTLTNINLWRTEMDYTTGNILAASIEQNTTLLVCDVGHNDIQRRDLIRIVKQMDQNLAKFEENERYRRNQSAIMQGEESRRQAAEDKQRKESELAAWLQEQRDKRADDKRKKEEERIRQKQEDLAEEKRLQEMQKAAELKAAEEAAAKKAKKAAKKK